MRTAPPAYDQVLEIPTALQASVTQDFIDINGHMNTRHYLEYGAISADTLCREVGIDDEYRRTRRLGIFTAEHHLRYLHEVREGETFSLHPRVLARSDKAVHLLSHLLDRKQRADRQHARDRRRPCGHGHPTPFPATRWDTWSTGHDLRAFWAQRRAARGSLPGDHSQTIENFSSYRQEHPENPSSAGHSRTGREWP
jgi:acyl-CoA thioesterase FadM